MQRSWVRQVNHNAVKLKDGLQTLKCVNLLDLIGSQASRLVTTVAVKTKKKRMIV